MREENDTEVAFVLTEPGMIFKSQHFNLQFRSQVHMRRANWGLIREIQLADEMKDFIKLGPVIEGTVTK